MSTRESPTITAAREREARAPLSERRARGVVHTPMVLARFAMRRVDDILRESFGLAQGLGEPCVSLLDPAVGTGVWLSAALECVSDAASSRNWRAFDVDAVALETARSVLAEEARAKAVSVELHCENTLAIASPWPAAEQVVRVIVGNPPWAARSLTRGATLSDAWLEEFRAGADGKRLSERRTGVLSDDYVRFFRWALEQVRTAPNGALLAFVTNHSYLDGPVHRGMRAALRSAFDRIEVLELGGNALLSRGSGRDENVFGVRVGAALMLGSRLPGSHRRQAALHVARVTGTRDEKLGSLHRAPLVALQDNAPEAPWSPRTNKRFERASLSLSQIFPFHREGIQTNRDAVATAHTHVELANRLADIAEGRLQLKASRHFEPKQAQSVLQRALSDGNLGIRTLAYRPLDTRVFCSLQPVCHRPRPELLKAMDHSNLCLLSVRKDRGEAPFRLFAASRHVADSCYLSTRSSCRTRVFPSRTPEGLENLSAHAQEAFGRIGTVMTAETVMAYALGLLLSSSYREEQGDALKEDYAAIALPPSAAAFTELVQAGRYLIDALTADARELSAPQARPSTGQRVTGSVDLDALRFSADRRVLLLGSEIVVEGVGTETWECVVGQFKLRQTAGPAPRAKMPLSDLLLCLQRAEQIERAHTLADKKFREHFL